VRSALVALEFMSVVAASIDRSRATPTALHRLDPLLDAAVVAACQQWTEAGAAGPAPPAAPDLFVQTTAPGGPPPSILLPKLY